MFRCFDPEPGSSPGQAGLNQLTQYAGKTLSHDAKGNVTAFGSDTFGYSSENLLTSATVAGTGTTLTYDPLMRLYQTVSGSTTSRFAYDGLDAIAEYNASGTLQRRWVFDPTTGQPLVQFEGAGTGSTSRRYLSANELGSIISVSDSTGVGLAINKYDEFGIPSLTAYSGRYGYTGQAWLPSAQLWHYKARAYHPGLGRFLQPDPIGYWDSPNLYAYVLNDPVNLVDPLGLQPWEDWEHPPVEVVGERDIVWLADLGFGDIFKGGNRGFEPILRLPKDDRAEQEKKLPQCVLSFLELKGLRAPNLAAVTFRRGDAGNWAAAKAHARGHRAITIGNTIYVREQDWRSLTYPRNNPVYFEEVLHTMQWATTGKYDFGASWLLQSIFAGLVSGDMHNSSIEIQAGAMSKALAREYDKYREQNCS